MKNILTKSYTEKHIYMEIEDELTLISKTVTDNYENIAKMPFIKHKNNDILVSSCYLF